MSLTEKPTALMQNYAFIAVDDYDMRMYVLDHLKDKEKRNALIAEHAKFPRGGPTQPGSPPPLQSPTLKRLVDKLRMVPQSGKHTIVETIPWKEYTIGVLPGARGKPVKITNEKYKSREEAEHAIFRKRLKALCAHYDIRM
jgi:hypothetical protein